MGDGRINSGVELEFAIDKPVRVMLLDSIYDIMDFGEVEVLAAGTMGGVGKHGDSGLIISVGLIGFCGIFDDNVELFFGGVFVDAAVGESEELVPSFANKGTREVR